MNIQRLHHGAKQYRALIPFRVVGIPCLIGVSDYINVPPWKGSAHSCPSSADYYGYEECSFDVLDRRGRKADWLSRKMLPADSTEVEEAVMEEMRKREEEALDDYRIAQWEDRDW